MQRYAIACDCEECGGTTEPLYLVRALDEAPGKVSYPLLGVFRFQRTGRLVFSSREEAELVQKAVDHARSSQSRGLDTQLVKVSADEPPWRLAGPKRRR